MACGIPLGHRGNTGFMLLQPHLADFRSLLPHLQAGIACHHEADGSMINTTLERPCFKDEQTGMACYFSASKRMQVLPCTYQWDVSYPLHAHGEEHQRGCVRNPLGSGSLGSGFTCNVVADYVSEHCLWPSKPEQTQVHSVHFKGRQKPWMQIVPSCARVTGGAMRTNSGRVRVDRGEDVAWSGGACRLKRIATEPHGDGDGGSWVSGVGKPARVPHEAVAGVEVSAAMDPSRQLAMTYDEAAQERHPGKKRPRSEESSRASSAQVGLQAGDTINVIGAAPVILTRGEVNRRAVANSHVINDGTAVQVPLLEAKVVAVLPAVGLDSATSGDSGTRNKHTLHVTDVRVGEVVTWADGEKVAMRCCHTINAVKAQWYHVARSVEGWDLLQHAIPSSSAYSPLRAG